jgi:hypothetical protein
MEKKHKLIKISRGLRRNYNRFWIIRKEQQRDLQDLCKKKRINLRLEKD